MSFAHRFDLLLLSFPRIEEFVSISGTRWFRAGEYKDLKESISNYNFVQGSFFRQIKEEVDLFREPDQTPLLRLKIMRFRDE